MTERIRITPEMIRLYDEYTHVTLDRRGFMAKLSKVAGSTAAAAAIVPLLEANKASAAIVPPDDASVTTERIEFTGATGQMTGYLALPAAENSGLPAVIVIHENRGLNPHIEDVARRLAVNGFAALAVDFLSPAGGTPEDEDRAREMIGELDGKETLDNAVAAVRFMSTHPAGNGNVGAVGFCWGGGLVNQLATASEYLTAGVVYYGRTPDPAAVPNIRARMLFHYAGLDERINAGRADYETALQAAGVEFESHLYDNVNHAFNNDTSSARYDQAAADLAWERTTEFLHRYLGD
jgi:carboxymethylenebutenolidase